MVSLGGLLLLKVYRGIPYDEIAKKYNISKSYISAKLENISLVNPDNSRLYRETMFQPHYMEVRWKQVLNELDHWERMRYFQHCKSKFKNLKDWNGGYYAYVGVFS